MKISATVLCNNILIRSWRDSVPISPMKLQRILYYICVKYAQNTGNSPISEDFEVWKYGPVVPSVYAKFNCFGKRPIKTFSKNAGGNIQIMDEELAPRLSAIIDEVWNQLKHYSGIELSKKTQQKNSGWYLAYQNNLEAIPLLYDFSY